MRKFYLKAFTSIILILLSLPISADNKDKDSSKVEFSVNADLVSSYVYRGERLAGASFQPSLGISYSGLSLEAWGSTDFNNVINEFDWILGYRNKGFYICIADFYGPYIAEDTPKYLDSENHLLEGTISFDFGSIWERFPLSLSWSTSVYNDKNQEGEEQYTSYCEMSYPITVKETTISFILGLTPWEGYYSDGFNVVNISILGSKDIKITDKFALPIFSQVTLNPYTENVYFVFGLSF